MKGESIRMLGLLTGLLVSLELAPVLPAAAQQPQAVQAAGDQAATTPPQDTEDEIFFESVDVNVVNVEVFATDRDGNPVRGLTKEDFELFEDGKPMTISNFLAVEGSRGGVAGQPAQDQRPEVPRDQRLHVVVFFDNFNLLPPDRNRVIEHLRRFLRTGLDNQDRAMLVSFDGNIHVLQEFTSLPELLIEPLATLEKTSGRSVELELDRRMILESIDEARLDNEGFSQNTVQGLALQALTGIRLYAQRVNERARATFGAMEQLISSLSGLSGRKALLYVTGGIPMRPADALLDAWYNKFSSLAGPLGVGSTNAESLSYDNTKAFQDLVAHANGNRVVLYTIDATGGRSFGPVSAETGGFDVGALNTAGGGRTWDADLEGRESGNVRGALSYLAESTGGLAFTNTRGLSTTLEKLANDFDVYYSLGYSPQSTGDGKYRQLKVKVAKPGIRVRHRAGYQDKSVEEKMGDRTLSALLLNIEDNPLGIELERAQAQPDAKGEKGIYQVPVLVKVPLGNLALLPGEETFQGRIAVFIAVGDTEGGTSPVSRVTLPIKIPRDRMEQAALQFAGYSFNIRMREGFQRVAVGVRDEVAAVSSTVRMNFRVGS